MSVTGVNNGSVPQREQSISSVSHSSGKTTNVAQRTLDSRDQAIWTCVDFDWALRNPMPDIVSMKNDFVTEQWSTDFFVASKKGIGLAKESLKNFALSVKHRHPIDATKHLLNALAIATQGAVSIEVANLLKGIVGTLVSTAKFPIHTITAVGSLFVAIVTVFAGPNMGKEIAKECFEKALKNFGLAAKDIVSALSCLGHAIPSWLAPLIMVTCPPAGVALVVIKVLTKFAGSSDLVGYGGTAILLYTKAKLAKGNTPEDQATKQAWNNLKEELNPTKSSEGALLAFYGAHIFCEAATTVLDAVAPGVGTLAKYGSYGAQALTGMALAKAVHANSKKSQESME